MKSFVALLAVVALLLSCTESSAQVQTVLDGAYVKEHNFTKAVISYPHLREADVLWAKRVWQVIDLREKMNHPFYYPTEEIEDRKSLFDVIRYALLTEGSLTASRRLAPRPIRRFRSSENSSMTVSRRSRRPIVQAVN